MIKQMRKFFIAVSVILSIAWPMRRVSAATGVSDGFVAAYYAVVIPTVIAAPAIPFALGEIGRASDVRSYFWPTYTTTALSFFTLLGLHLTFYITSNAYERFYQNHSTMMNSLIIVPAIAIGLLTYVKNLHKTDAQPTEIYVPFGQMRF